MKSILSIAILSLILLTNLKAQEFGGFPSNIKWQEINTKHVRVIFPKGLEKRAFRIATIINHENEHNTYSVGNNSKKLDLILQTNQVISNGFVTLSPYRSEFYGTGLQDPNIVGSLDWLDILSIHEYRHALQYTNGKRGFTKFLSILQGQNGWSLGINLSLPGWYFEGDAVDAETFLSKAGRGRTPSFFKELRANFFNNRNYSYLTARNGSYTKMLPNRYPMGYTIVNYVRNNYGEQVWKDILADAGSYSSIIYPFSGAMKKHTGKRAPQMYQLAYDALKQQWNDELKNINLIPTQQVMPKNKRTVTNYSYPQILNDGSIVAIKDSYKSIKQLVHIKNGKETKLCNYGIAPADFLSANNNKVAWVELQQDPRRANQNYTRIVAYDVNTKEKRYVTSKSKYFSPQFSSKGNQIIAVKADAALQNNLVIIDANTGKELKKLPNSKNDFLAFPKWTNNDNSIVYLAKRNSELAILKLDLDTQSITELTNWTAHIISDINVVGNTVYYTSSYSGIDNIYAVNTSGNKKITQISSVKVGAYQPAVSSNKQQLVMVEFSDMGTLLTKMNLNEVAPQQQPFTYKEPIDMDRFHIKTNAHEHNILDKIKDTTYQVKAYKGLLKGTKLHSWGFGISKSESFFLLNFANVLSNLRANLGAVYNKNEKQMNFIGNVIYSKYFVEMGLHAAYLNRNYNEHSSFDESFVEKNYGVSLGIPLQWNSGSFRFMLQPQAAYTYHNTFDYSTFNLYDSYPKLNFGSVTGQFAFAAKQIKAKQNIQSRYGVELSAKYQKSLKSNVKAECINLNGALFLPALMQNHGIKITGTWQKEPLSNNFRFVDKFDYARGYESRIKDEIYKVSFNYSLPLLYPDWGFGGITYFKRISANLFYDISNINYAQKSYHQNSYGIELFFDNTVFNLLPLTFGFRESILLNTDIIRPDRKTHFEFVLKMGL